MTPIDVAAAYDALDKADTALQKLSDSCCEPGRSPRMKRLGETLATTRSTLEQAGDDRGEAQAVIGEIEDAGAQLGRLQVGCCALSRMPLYAEMLEELTKAQRTVTRAYDLGH